MAFLLCWTAAVVEEGTMISYAQRPAGDPVQLMAEPFVCFVGPDDVEAWPKT
jgi:hypothetical protein